MAISKNKVRIRIGDVEIKRCTDLQIELKRKVVFETTITIIANDTFTDSFFSNEKKTVEVVHFTENEVLIQRFKKCELFVTSQRCDSGVFYTKMELTTNKKPKTKNFKNIWWMQ